MFRMHAIAAKNETIYEYLFHLPRIISYLRGGSNNKS